MPLLVLEPTELPQLVLRLCRSEGRKGNQPSMLVMPEQLLWGWGRHGRDTAVPQVTFMSSVTLNWKRALEITAHPTPQ